MLTLGRALFSYISGLVNRQAIRHFDLVVRDTYSVSALVVIILTGQRRYHPQGARGWSWGAVQEGSCIGKKRCQKNHAHKITSSCSQDPGPC